MHKRTFVILLALIVAVTPFLGFPSSWESIAVATCGVAIALLMTDFGFMRKKKAPKRRKRDAATGADTYVENVPTRATEEFKSESRFS